jgi:hypothetical protein
MRHEFYCDISVVFCRDYEHSSCWNMFKCEMFKPINIVHNESVGLRLRNEASFVLDIKDSYL